MYLNRKIDGKLLTWLEMFFSVGNNIKKKSFLFFLGGVLWFTKQLIVSSTHCPRSTTIVIVSPSKQRTTFWQKLLLMTLTVLVFPSMLPFPFFRKMCRNCYTSHLIQFSDFCVWLEILALVTILKTRSWFIKIIWVLNEFFVLLNIHKHIYIYLYIYAHTYCIYVSDLIQCKCPMYFSKSIHLCLPLVSATSWE